MKKGLKKLLSCNKLTLIMSIITLLIGCWIYFSTTIGLPLKFNLIILLISFIPFFIYLFMSIISYKSNKNIGTILTILSIFIASSLVVYYFLVLFISVLIVFVNPITDPKYYNYYVRDKTLNKVFPEDIPKDVNDVNFHFSPAMMQAGTVYTLYYVDNNMTAKKFADKYSRQAIWIGKKEDYSNKDLLKGAFSFTPAKYNNEDDYTIYLIEGECDDSGYCNHGLFLLAAYNEKTNEVIFAYEDW